MDQIDLITQKMHETQILIERDRASYSLSREVSASTIQRPSHKDVTIPTKLALPEIKI